MVREEVQGLVGRVKENKGSKIREEEGGEHSQWGEGVMQHIL